MRMHAINTSVLLRELAEVLIKHGVPAELLDDVFEQVRDVAFNMGIHNLYEQYSKPTVKVSLSLNQVTDFSCNNLGGDCFNEIDS
jgi:hypothetical protein